MKTNTLDFDAQALREKILDLAMRGKLVPQDSNDEPASLLLEKIKAEKAVLVKKKKIKKTKTLPEITDNEKPFAIPNSWKWVRFSEILDVRDGTHNTPKYFDQGVPLVTSKNLKNGQIDFSNVNYISAEDAEEINKRSKADIGDIIFAMIGTIGNPAVVKTSENFSIKNVALLKNIYDINSMYIYYFVSFNQANYRRIAAGGTQKFVSLKKIRETVLPLPPLAEQKRIAAKITQLFSLISKIEEASKQYKELQTSLKSKVLDLAMRGKLVEQNPNDEPASVLLDKIKAEKAKLVKEKKIRKSKPLPEITDNEKPFGIPDGWEWVRIGDIVVLKNGKTPPKKDIHNSGQYPYFKVKDMNNNELYMQKVENYVDEQYKSKIMPKNTIIFPKNGGAVLTAKKRILIQDSLVDLNTSGIISSTDCDPMYIFYLFSSLDIRKYVKGSAVPTIDSKKLMETPVPLPPFNEQKRIVSRIEKIFVNASL